VISYESPFLNLITHKCSVKNALHILKFNYTHTLGGSRSNREEGDVERLPCGVNLFDELNLRDRLKIATIRGYTPLSLLLHSLL
jgi:hypothetical protein